MADFSKQWAELNDPEFPWDFDILEEYDKLEDNRYVGLICEGFGFIAIGKIDGVYKLYFPDDENQTGKWVDYDTFINQYKTNNKL